MRDNTNSDKGGKNPFSKPEPFPFYKLEYL